MSLCSAVSAVRRPVSELKRDRLLIHTLFIAVLLVSILYLEDGRM